jgi:thiol-disulfide isomerase/thioredoxin
LGAALATNWRPRWTLPVAMVLLVFFLGLTTYAWIEGATEECGCFGSLVQRSPGEAAVEDAVLVLVLAFGWWFGRGSAAVRGDRWLVLGVAVLSVGLTAARFLPGLERLDKSDLLPGVRLTGLEAKGVPHDLMRGAYLVELMSPKCGHCLDAIPKLNQLAGMPDLPRLVALTSFAQDSEEMVEFRREQDARYPVGSVSRTDFFRLTWKHGYPRLALIRDGVVRQVWERDQFPTIEAIRAATAQP